MNELIALNVDIGKILIVGECVEHEEICESFVKGAKVYL